MANDVNVCLTSYLRLVPSSWRACTQVAQDYDHALVTSVRFAYRVSAKIS